MPVIFTYNNNLPYHSSHKLDGKWRDICLGNGDTIELSEAEQAEPTIKNLVKTKILVAVKPAKPEKPAKPALKPIETN